MARPSIQFYPADWQRNANLRRCSHAARGGWMDVLCLLHDSDECGLIRWPLGEIAQATGVPMTLIREIVQKNVLKGCDKGECEPYTYTPRSGRKDGPTVILVPAQEGPIWFSSRMVRDEYVITTRGTGSRFGDVKGDGSGAPKPSPIHRVGEGKGDVKGEQNNAPSPAPTRWQGDGSSSASAGSSSGSSGSPFSILSPESRSDEDARARTLLARICQILRLELQASPDRITWFRQVSEMLRDGLMEPEIIAATEACRTHGKVSLAYIRAIALNPKPQGSGGGNGHGRRESCHEQTARIIAEDLRRDAAESNTPANQGANDRVGALLPYRGDDR